MTPTRAGLGDGAGAGVGCGAKALIGQCRLVRARPAKTKISVSQTFARPAIGAREKKERKSGIARTKPDVAVARAIVLSAGLCLFLFRFCFFSAPPSLPAPLCIFVLFFFHLFFFFFERWR